MKTHYDGSGCMRTNGPGSRPYRFLSIATIMTLYVSGFLVYIAAGAAVARLRAALMRLAVSRVGTYLTRAASMWT